MTFKNFPTPHCHIQSLDSASTPEAFIERELELETGYVTCTDHGTLQATRKVYDLAKANKITPILGLEGYFRDDDCPILNNAGIQKDEKGTFIPWCKYHHVTIHYLDQKAYECGIQLLSKADERAERWGAERKPLFNWANLEELCSQNVTIGSSCLVGMVARHVLDQGNIEIAQKYYERLRGLVPQGRFIVELFPHDCSQNWIKGVFITLADGTKIKYHAKKIVKTNVGEITVSELAKAFGSKNNEHTTLIAIKNYSKWDDMPPTEIKIVEHLNGFINNECSPIFPDGDVQRGLNRVMKAFAKKYGDKIVVSDDSHYALPEESIIQNVRLAQNNWSPFYGNYARQSSEQSFEHFRRTLGTSEKEFEEWVDNGHEWANQFKNFKLVNEVSLPTKFYEIKYCEHPWHKNPKIEPKDHSLMYTMELIKKHGRMDWKNEKYKARLQEEIKLLHDNGTIDLLPYFFVVEEVCALYEEAELLVGVGRGSAAGLLLSYLLGVTHVDPLKYNLSLDRFLTLDRIKSGKFPDIDTDFPYRDLLINSEGKGWLLDRFGDHFAQISVDSTLKSKMAIKDVARFRYGRVPDDIESWTRKLLMPPQGIDDYDFIMGYDNDEGHTVGSIEYDPILKDYIKKYPQDWEIVKKCLGLARQKSRHPCAFVIANKPIREFIPLQTISDVQVTSYTANSVEAVGGLKYDFLVVNSLADLGDAVKLVQKRSGQEIPKKLAVNGKQVPNYRLVPVNGELHDLWDLPEDQNVFADISLGKTETVFQYNTNAAIKWLNHFSHKRPDGKYAINSIDGMAAFTALDRPGPLDINVTSPDGGKHNMLVEYARRARGASPSLDVLPIFDELASETYGVMTYQEQLQYIYQQLTGCTGPEAEEFRRKIAKKKKEEVDAAYPFFIEHATKTIGEEDAKAAWQFFVTWAKYGFGKSHAVCYAITGYACAFLKHHYPLEWWTSVLKNAAKNEVNEKFWQHCGHLIDLPDVNLSGDFWEIQNDRIRAPLALLKGVGETAHKELCLYRPYGSIKELVQKIEDHKVKTGTWVNKTVEKIVIDPATGKRKRWLNPETGKKENVKVTVEEPKLQKGRTSLNRKVIYILIISGAMDSLFSPDMIMSERLQAYEIALAEVSAKPGKEPKVKAVDPKYALVSAANHFQMRKAILPAYGQDLMPIVISNRPNGLSVSEKSIPVETEDSIEYVNKKIAQIGWLNDHNGRHEHVRLVNGKEFEVLQNSSSIPGETVRVAMAVYVEEVEGRTFEKNGERKEMCKVVLDVEGGRYELVKWPNKENVIPAIFKQPIKGSIAIGILSRYKTEGKFNLDDLIIIEPPLDYKEESEENEKQKD